MSVIYFARHYYEDWIKILTSEEFARKYFVRTTELEEWLFEEVGSTNWERLARRLGGYGPSNQQIMLSCLR